MAIVTLTTDYGWSDFYTAALKVRIIGRSPGVQLFDISQNIEPFNIAAAAYQVRSSMNFFPEGTIHCIDVTSFHNGYVLMQFNNQYVLSFDNGVFSLILNHYKPQGLWEINIENLVEHPSFPAIDVFPEVIHHLLVKKKLDGIAKPTTQLYASEAVRPIIHDKMIRASVIHVDSYENVIVNISKDEFDEVSKGRRYLIRIRRAAEIEEVMDHYHDVPHSELVAFFRSAGFMELAMNRGNIAGINGLTIGDIVQIDFM